LSLRVFCAAKTYPQTKLKMQFTSLFLLFAAVFAHGGVDHSHEEMTTTMGAYPSATATPGSGSSGAVANSAGLALAALAALL
jgi:hypothetical protein